MAWNTPTTWVAGTDVAAADLNAQLRDNFKAIGDPWTSFTPTWTASTNPAIGNGSISGAYMQAGKLVHYWVSIVMGSTTTYGSGAWSIAPPVPALVSRLTIQGLIRDTSANAYYPIRTLTSGGALACDGTTAGGPVRSVAATVPFTWATNDELILSGTYEAA